MLSGFMQVIGLFLPSQTNGGVAFYRLAITSDKNSISKKIQNSDLASLPKFDQFNHFTNCDSHNGDSRRETG